MPEFDLSTIPPAMRDPLKEFIEGGIDYAGPTPMGGIVVLSGSDAIRIEGVVNIEGEMTCNFSRAEFPDTETAQEVVGHMVAFATLRQMTAQFN